MWIDEESAVTFTSHDDIRRAFSFVSLPAVISDADLDGIGVYPVVVTERPEFDPMTQTCVEGAITQVDGVWTRGWDIWSKTAEEIQAAQLAHVQSVAKEATDAIQAMLDSKCREYEYDTINNATGWAAHFADAAALADWGAACWAKSKQMRDEFLAGTRTLPRVEEVLAEMPAFPGVNI